MSKLYFRYGAMNCGKTTSLLHVAYNYEEKDMRVPVSDGSIIDVTLEVEKNAIYKFKVYVERCNL